MQARESRPTALAKRSSPRRAAVPKQTVEVHVRYIDNPDRALLARKILARVVQRLLAEQE